MNQIKVQFKEKNPLIYSIDMSSHVLCTCNKALFYFEFNANLIFDIVRKVTRERVFKKLKFRILKMCKLHV